MASFRAEYPAAQRLDLVEDLFGHRVADPYRWLEDADSPQTRKWLAAEESLWEEYQAIRTRSTRSSTSRIRTQTPASAC
jgi:protease II